jgi:hypothetical protein
MEISIYRTKLICHGIIFLHFLCSVLLTNLLSCPMLVVLYSILIISFLKGGLKYKFKKMIVYFSISKIRSLHHVHPFQETMIYSMQFKPYIKKCYVHWKIEHFRNYLTFLKFITEPLSFLFIVFIIQTCTYLYLDYSCT